MSCSENKNPLQHSGTSRQDRLLPALQTGYIKIDERDYQDWIVFANAFAGFLKYFDINDATSADWTSFFTTDISSVLASVAVQDINLYREQIKERFDFLKENDHRSDIPGLEINLNELFSALLTLSKAMDEYYAKLPDNIILKNTLLNLIKKLSPLLNRLIIYYTIAGPANLDYLTTASFNNWNILNKDVVDAGVIINNIGLSNNWITDGSGNWNTYVTNIVSAVSNGDSIFDSLLADAAATNDEKEFLRIQHAANHNLFSGIFDQYLFAYTKFANQAFDELQQTLSNRDDHQPHYALFLSFLKLFRFVQTQVNTITKSHLDFYYKEVLQLQPKPAEPNHVHILIELAKQVDDYLLSKQTQLKAGKDSAGKEVIYALDADTTFNKAKVSQLKSIYFANSNDDIKDAASSIIQNNDGRLFASPVTNSDDGLGAELTSANKEWHPYVHKVFNEGSLVNIAMPKAQIGFAIASHYLYLTEGERKVYIRLVTSNNSLLKNKHIECYLTTEKNWYKVDDPVLDSGSLFKLSDNTTLCIQISFTLPGNAPAITNYNAAVHGGIYNCPVPVLKIYLSNDGNNYEYNDLKDLQITKAEIKVDVGFDSGYNQKGLKNLLVSNDFGAIDSSKQFQAFGAQPTTGNNLIIGSKEIFTKKNTAIKLNLEWKGLPQSRENVSFISLSDSGNYPNIAVNYLEGGVWKTFISKEELFEDYSTDGVSTTRQISLSGADLNNTIVDYGENYLPYNITSNKGFIQLQLTQSFGFKEYMDALTIYLIEKANKTAPPTYSTKPVEPYTPIIQSLYFSYSAYTTINLASTYQNDFDNREIQFFHIYPFGEAEQHAFINKQNNNAEGIYLLPQFKHAEKDAIGNTTLVADIGEFYIGIEKLQPKDAINILFEVLEGTTDPLIVKPDDHIHWSYLSNNQWLSFGDEDISDATLNLIQSGIISFAIPPLATAANTLLPAGYIWIKAGISAAAEAICKLLTVDPQAASATFLPNDNADDFLNNPLEAATVSKLKTPDAAVKKITQPYPSFGGKPIEDETNFYVRVSERLRHKARAITIWDYEHLILEAFPEIYKVKCLNHTSVTEVANISEYNEVHPGNVLIITIPLLNNRNDANPLKPYTNQSTLTKIEKYIKERASCFVTVKAREPQFEEVRMMFKLKLYAAYKDFTFYSNMLKDEITQFLTPWANNSNTEIQFGGKIEKSAIINFIEERYYVDYITEVRMFQKINDQTAEMEVAEEAVASASRSILVSAPASKHIIVQIIEDSANGTEECADMNAFANR